MQLLSEIHEFHSETKFFAEAVWAFLSRLICAPQVSFSCTCEAEFTFDNEPSIFLSEMKKKLLTSAKVCLEFSADGLIFME